jgi:hypothetical protein
MHNPAPVAVATSNKRGQFKFRIHPGHYFVAVLGPLKVKGRWVMVRPGAKVSVKLVQISGT